MNYSAASSGVSKKENAYVSKQATGNKTHVVGFNTKLQKTELIRKRFKGYNFFIAIKIISYILYFFFKLDRLKYSEFLEIPDEFTS